MKRLLKWSAALAVCLFAAEVVSRLDDWIFQDVPFLASPDRERDLMVHDEFGVRGRPNGRYKKYVLNEFGFRGPPISKKTPDGVLRIMVLGASETFGLYESEGREFPAMLARDLEPSPLEIEDAKAAGKPPPPKVEVINAAVAGMALPTLLDYWKKWASEFRPDVVIIYPSPQFYLDNEQPRPAKAPETPPVERWQSRFLERLKDTAKQNDVLKAIRVRWVLHRELSGKDDSWVFSDVPEDRIEAFQDDLRSLIVEIQQSGSKVVLVTHAFKNALRSDRDRRPVLVDPPLDGRDLAELNAYRVFFPRALPNTMLRFDASANLVVRNLGRDHDCLVIGAARVLNSQRDLFADPTHFNDKGAARLADLIAEELRSSTLLKEIEEGRR